MKKVEPTPEPDNFFRKYKATTTMLDQIYMELRKDIERTELHSYIKTDGKLDHLLLERSQGVTVLDVELLGKFMLIQDIQKKLKTTAPESKLKIPDEIERTVDTVMGPLKVNVLTGEVTDKTGTLLDKDVSEQIVKQMLEEMENE